MLGALTQGGRLRVAEQSGLSINVVVDEVVVGKAPWEGTLAIGDHTVALRGEGNLGTQPASAPIKLNQLTALTLAAEQLEGRARVEPTPIGSVVSIDRVAVGRGVWEGKLRVGGHLVEVAEEGFVPFHREISLSPGQRTVITASLDRDLTSSLWAEKHPSHLMIEVDGLVGFAPVTGGDIQSSCTGSCSTSLPFFGGGLIRGGYQLSMGLGFGVDVGYMDISSSVTNRATQILPTGNAPVSATVKDDVRLSGLNLGASAFYRRGDDWPVTLRMGLGVVLGSIRDQRAGSGMNSFGETFTASGAATATTPLIYAAPEARVGRRFADHFELSVGIEARIMAPLGQVRFSQSVLQNTVAAHPVATDPKTGATNNGDGEGPFSNETLIGSLIFALAPSLGARYDF